MKSFYYNAFQHVHKHCPSRTMVRDGDQQSSCAKSLFPPCFPSTAFPLSNSQPYPSENSTLFTTCQHLKTWKTFSNNSKGERITH